MYFLLLPHYTTTRYHAHLLHTYTHSATPPHYTDTTYLPAYAVWTDLPVDHSRWYLLPPLLRL